MSTEIEKLESSLYKLKIKENNSYKNLAKKDEQLVEQMRLSKDGIAIRRKNVSNLDREFWKQYLDFSIIDKWIEGNCSMEDDAKITRAVMICIWVEHLVKRSREANLSS